MARMSCGQAVIELLAAHGVDTVFGIPGIHTLEMYRGMGDGRIRHVTPRHEQGAGFMADGYARVTGRPGVCLLTSGPGLTNAVTAVAQAYSCSVPMLVLSTVTERAGLRLGHGRLHEISSQRDILAPVCAFSHTLMDGANLPEVMARAFAVFSAGRPRPVHIEIPVDVLGSLVELEARPIALPGPPAPSAAAVEKAAALLAACERPVIIAGGGAARAAMEVRGLAERLNAPVVLTVAGKGILPDAHPLNLGSACCSPVLPAFIAKADLVLAVGTELAETDFWTGLPRLAGPLIRVDVDPSMLTAPPAPTIPLLGDAGETLAMLSEKVPTGRPRIDRRDEVRAVRREAEAAEAVLLPHRRHMREPHERVLRALRSVLPADGIVVSDMTQISYSGNSVFPTDQPATWLHPKGFGTLGYALPAAVGAQLAAPERMVVALVGDGGLMFTVQELMTAVELRLPLAVLLWNDGGYGMVRDSMDALGLPRIGVTLSNPDFPALARAFGCHAERPGNLGELTEALRQAARGDGPTLIEIREDAAFLGSVNRTGFPGGPVS